MDIVVVVIRKNNGQYFVHQRRDDKKTYPGLYALGIGGRVEPGEAKSIAASRELKEEAEIDEPIKFLFSMDMKDIGLRQIVHVHELIYNGEIDTCLDEWQWSGWMAEKEIDQLMEDDKLCPDTAKYYKKYKKL